MRGRQLPNALFRAFDEAHFGPSRTLNLRDSLPSGAQAAARAESWLRMKQVEGIEEVLIVTGRGSHSRHGLPVVRPQVARRLAQLRRAGVVSEVREHSPGSYVVRLARVADMLARERRAAEPSASMRSGARGPRSAPPQLPVPVTPETGRLLEDLARRVLESLGIRAPSATMVREEMRHQLEVLTRGAPAPPGDRGDRWLRDAARRALDDLAE